jgi:hypothetical protein
VQAHIDTFSAAPSRLSTLPNSSPPTSSTQ